MQGKSYKYLIRWHKLAYPKGKLLKCSHVVLNKPIMQYAGGVWPATIDTCIQCCFHWVKEEGMVSYQEPGETLNHEQESRKQAL